MKIKIKAQWLHSDADWMITPCLLFAYRGATSRHFRRGVGIGLLFLKFKFQFLVLYERIQP